MAYFFQSASPFKNVSAPGPSSILNINTYDDELNPELNVNFILSMRQSLKNGIPIKQNGVLWTSNIQNELPIRMHCTDSTGSLPAKTVIEMFRETVEKYGTRQALAYRKPCSGPKSAVWNCYTWNSYWKETCNFAKSLLALGVTPYTRVLILGCNAPYWLIAYLGSIFAKTIPCGIYTTDSAESLLKTKKWLNAEVVVVDQKSNLEKVMKYPELYQSLRAIVVYYDDTIPAHFSTKGVQTWTEFLKHGAHATDVELLQRMESQKPGECASIVLTSGTTGNSKGAMVSHDNLTWTARSAATLLNLNANQIFVSFLPLSHVAAQTIDILVPLVSGICVHFAPEDALRGTLFETIKEVRPSWLLAVPRVWEKLEEALKAFGKSNSKYKQILGNWAKSNGYKGTMAKLEGTSTPWGYYAAEAIVLKSIRKVLGLDRCAGFASCAAPLKKSTQEYFCSLGMPICDIYGMTECSGPQTFNVPVEGRFKIGSIGKSIPGSEISIYLPDKTGEGEVCMRGRNVFMGYFDDSKSTMETIDQSGYLHSGDLGRIDNEGFVHITGRAKEILVTSGGENVSPLYLERLIADKLPICGNCMIIGDGQKFLSAFICIRPLLDQNGAATDNIDPSVIKLITQHGSNALTLGDTVYDKAIDKLVREAILRVNENAISRAQHVRAWRLLPKDFTVDGGELTATLKLRRRIIVQKYKHLIDDIYRARDNQQPTLGHLECSTSKF